MDVQPDTFQNKIRNIFWPVHRHELSFFLSMAGLMFCILFNQNVLRILKDSILISEVSAEVTSFVKVYCVTPAAALFVILYAKMVNHWKFETIYYYLIWFFTGFFIIFAFILYPHIHHFHADTLMLDKAMTKYPHLKWYIALAGNWSYMLFYTLAELWPNIFYILLFWQFANSITSTSEAKRFYTLFSLFGNSSLVFVGLLMINLSSEKTFIQYFIPISNDKIILVKTSILCITITTIISCLLVKFIKNHAHCKKIITKSTDNKMGVVEGFKYIAKSKYLWLMLICSGAFGLAINLVEAVWKAKIKEMYPTVNSYAEFNSMYILWTGITIMIMTIIGNNIMRRYGWFITAVISPVIILVTGVLFFMLVVFDNVVTNFLDGIILMSPLALAVFVGALQNILAKGTKYSLWDTSREMLYIPLDNELKTKGKAAVDVISSKVGKSSSGLIQSIIFTIIPTATFNSISPFLMIIFTCICIIWVYAVRKIYFEYQKIIGSLVHD